MRVCMWAHAPMRAHVVCMSVHVGARTREGERVCMCAPACVVLCDLIPCRFSNHHHNQDAGLGDAGSCILGHTNKSPGRLCFMFTS